MAYCFLCDGEIGIHDERWLMYPWGVLGGETGLRSTKRLVRADGCEEWLPAKVEGIKVKQGDVLYFNTWGGGGWGDPFKRDPELVRKMSSGAWSVGRARSATAWSSVMMAGWMQRLPPGFARSW